MLLGGPIDVGPDGATADARDPELRIDLYAGDPSHVEDQTIVAQTPPGYGVTPATHCNLELMLPGEPERGDDVPGCRAARHEPRLAVTHRVKQRARIDVLHVTTLVQAAVQPPTQPL
jgi:hypothetical protein